MKTFYVPSELFQDMKKGNSWEKLVTNYKEVPNLRGGLDHIFETKNQFIFSDIGCNGHDNSFIVRSKKNDVDPGIITWNQFLSFCKIAWKTEGQGDASTQLVHSYLLRCEKSIDMTKIQVAISAYQLYKANH